MSVEESRVEHGERTEEHAARSAAADGALPCLNSHNSTGEAVPKLCGSAAKTAYALITNVEALCKKYGINQIGFLTLTFADHVLNGKEAQRRFNSLATHVLRRRYQAYIRVLERHKSGRIHYHLLVVMPDGVDIRTGFDFDAVARKDYRTVSAVLRSEWFFLRQKLKEYRFGRSELKPIRSTSEAIAKYVGKYISKHIDQRQVLDKGLRLVEYSRGAKVANTQFAWNSPGSRTFRRNLGGLIGDFYAAKKIPSPTTTAMRAVFGPRWAWKWKDSILVRCDMGY